jgi:hypothetical protein
MRSMAITDPEKQAAALERIEKSTGLATAPRGAGGTPGGIGTFFFGLALVVIGGYLVLNQVQVTTSYTFFGLWSWSRPGGFGLTMLPLLIGIGVLFFDGKSKLGWFLALGGSLIILAAILMSLSIRWQPTSLFNALLMFGMLAGGLGLVLRSLRPDPAE